MNIVHITPYFPPHLGGLENVAKELSKRLAKKKENVEVFTSDLGCPIDKQINSEKNLRIHYLRSKFFYTPIIPSLYKELMKLPKNSIIHVHVAQAYIPEIVYKIWKKKGIPYVAQVHTDLKPTTFLGKIILSSYKRIFLKRFLQHAKKVIVLTEDYKQLVHKNYSIPLENIITIPNGVEEKFSYKKKKDNLPPHLLFVGRIVEEKNLPLLIESVNKCNANLILDLIGEGEVLEAIKYLAKRKKLKNIFFYGKKTNNDLIKFYQNSDVFISTTNQESFGITFLEAMASGLPIIASKVPGVRNVIKNNYNGILVQQTPEAFAKAIDNLLSNPKLRKKLSKNGLKEVKKYSWDKIADQYIQLYKQVLAEYNHETPNKTKK